MPLVEGSDLTVRGDRVYLKTLGGLRRVHSILRRLDDDYCDPLELRGDSALGVPGLHRCAARRPRHGVERARHRRARVRGLARLPAADLRTPHRREAVAARGRDLVAGREARARLRARESRPPGHQAYLSEPALRAHVRTRLTKARRATSSSRACATGRMPTWRRSTCACRRRRCGNPRRRPSSRRARSPSASTRSRRRTACA